MLESTGVQTLLEREDELALIDEVIDSAAEGGGSVTLVRGPAGIGKSELLSAAVSRSAGSGLETLAARGGEFERSFGFGLVRQLFASFLDDAHQRAALLQGAAGLAAPALLVDTAGAAEEKPAVPMGDPAAPIHHGLHWLVANLAERAPLLVAVDDLQWADPESARWLLYLARRIADLPVAVVLALRDGEPGLDQEIVTALESESGRRTLRPQPLSEPATAELLRVALDPGAEEEFCAAAHRAAGGNPLYLRELIAAARDANLAAVAESAPRLEDLRPEGISRSVLARISRLEEDAAQTARAVAILGDGTSLRRAAAFVGLGPNDAASAAGALVQSEILAPGESLGFAHPLIRSAVYRDIPAGGRAVAHSKAAQLLIADGAREEEVAGQLLYAEAGNVPGALEVLRRAAESAMSRGAPKAAIAYLRRAFAEPDARAQRRELLSQLLVAATTAAEISALEGICDDPVAELGDDPEVLRSSPAGDALVAWLFYTGRVTELEEQTRRGIAATVAGGDHDLALRRETLSLSIIDVPPEEAIRRLDRHAPLLRPNSQEERIWLAMKGWWRHIQGAPSGECVDLARRGIDRGELLEFSNLGPVFGQAVLVLLRADELDEAEPWVEAMIDDAKRRGPPYAMSAFGLRSHLAHRRGDLAAAELDGRTTVGICREHGIALGLAINLRFLMDALIDRGAPEEAESELVTSGFDGALPDFWWFFPLRFGRARLWIELGRIEQGIAALREMLRSEPAPQPGSEPIASTLALALHATGGDEDEIQRLLQWELEAAREWGTQRGLGIAHRAQGLVEGGEAGIELLRESAEVLRSSPARLELARSLTDLGSALRRANRRTDAREPLREAMELAHRCGAAPLAERAREELAATGAKPRRVMLTGVESLTPSELRVARLAAAGLGNREIAQELYISVKTVETHLGSAYRKLDIASRRELPGALETGPEAAKV
jgi:DNA-binding CsgD family transcriptional regulator